MSKSIFEYGLRGLLFHGLTNKGFLPLAAPGFVHALINGPLGATGCFLYMQHVSPQRRTLLPVRALQLWRLVLLLREADA